MTTEIKTLKTCTRPTGYRRTLAIIGQRMPHCDQAEGTLLDNASVMAREGVLVRWKPGMEGRAWEITFLGRQEMGKATKKCTWAKWAESMQPGGAELMRQALNDGGCEAGHKLLDQLQSQLQG